MIPDRDNNGAQHAREHERRTILVEARILDGEEWHDCRIVNISVGGAKLLIGRQFNHGTSVLLHIGNFGRFSGTAVWQNSEELGVKFTHDPAEIAEVVMGLAMYG